jgi:predicted neutral ceramidase superfamily lipid hydrolase
MVDLWHLHTSAYLWAIFFIHVTYAIVLVGFVETEPSYLADIEYYVKVYATIFLIWRFNPYSHTRHFTEIDRRIVFSVALFVLTTSVLKHVIQKYRPQIKAILRRIFHPLVSAVRAL